MSFGNRNFNKVTEISSNHWFESAEMLSSRPSHTVYCRIVLPLYKGWVAPILGRVYFLLSCVYVMIFWSPWFASNKRGPEVFLIHQCTGAWGYMEFIRKCLSTAASKNRDISGKNIYLIEVRKDLTLVYTFGDSRYGQFLSLTTFTLYSNKIIRRLTSLRNHTLRGCSDFLLRLFLLGSWWIFWRRVD
jgi:hypothetical protein